MNRLATSNYCLKYIIRGRSHFSLHQAKGIWMPGWGPALGPEHNERPCAPHAAVLCEAHGTTKLLKAPPGMEKPHSPRLSLPEEGEYSFMPKFCPQFSSHSSTREHLLSVFLLWRMIYILFFSTSVLSTSLVFVSSQEEWSEFMYQRCFMTLGGVGKTKTREIFFQLNSLDPCSSPEEKTMISPLVEQQWLRVTYWSPIARLCHGVCAEPTSSIKPTLLVQGL